MEARNNRVPGGTVAALGVRVPVFYASEGEGEARRGRGRERDRVDEMDFQVVAPCVPLRTGHGRAIVDRTANAAGVLIV